MSPKQTAALAAFAPAAVAVEKASGFPAEVIIAQWATESAWGEKKTGAFNYWGLTAATTPGAGRAFVPTTEELTSSQFEALPNDEKASLTLSEPLPNGKRRFHLSRWFASFSSLEEGLAAYVALLTNPAGRYWSAWATYKANGGIDRLIQGIAAAGYASGNEGNKYAELLKQIARQSSVQAAVLAAHEAARVKA